MSLIGSSDFEHFAFGAVCVGGNGLFIGKTASDVVDIYKFAETEAPTYEYNIKDNEEVNSETPSPQIKDKKIDLSKIKSDGKVTCEEANTYFQSVYDGGTIYVWGANYETITESLINSLYNTFKDSKHDYDYYQGKLAYAGRKGADCSGMFHPISGTDMSAAGYYKNYSVLKGEVNAMDTSRPAQLFRVGSSGSIVHTGWYCGNGISIEMSNNCERKTFSKSKWTYWSVPKWLDLDDWKTFGR